jgi:hypothetical protein
MAPITTPAVVLAHAGHAHAAAPGGTRLAWLVLAALPFLVGAVLGRARDGAVATIALFSAAAGFVHAVVTPEHFAEAGVVGVFFVAVTVGQMAVVVAALNRPSWALWVSAAVGNAAMVGIWVLSRTIGVPIGPEPWTPEAVGLLDLACAAYEIAIVVGCLGLARTSLVVGYSPATTPLDGCAALAKPL